MAVFRIERTKDYTVMSNHHLRNHELSLKAKGLLSMMLSLPDDWNYFCFVIFHISTVQQSRNPEYGTDIFACPIGNCLPLANQKLLMFLKVISHQVKGFF